MWGVVVSEDYEVNSVIEIMVENINGNTIEAVDDLADPPIRIYRTDDTIGTTTGVTYDVGYYPTGQDRLRIDLAADEDYFIPGHNYFPVYIEGTFAGDDISGRVITEGVFSIRNRSGVAGVPGGTPGDYAGIPMSNIWQGGGVAVAMMLQATIPEDVTDLVAVINNKRLSLGSDIIQYPTIWADAIYPEFADVDCTVSGRTITLTARTAGQPFQVQFLVYPLVTVEVVTPGILPIEQTQVITLPDGTTGGTWPLTVTCNGVSETYTGNAHNITGSALQAIVEDHAEIGAGNITITGPAGGPYVCKPTGDLAGINIPLIEASGVELTGIAYAVVETIQNGGGASDEIGFISLPYSGVALGFRLHYGSGYATVGSSLATLQADLEAIPEIGVGGIEVWGGWNRITSNLGYPYAENKTFFILYRFKGPNAGRNMQPLLMSYQYIPPGSPIRWTPTTAVYTTILMQGGDTPKTTILVDVRKTNSGAANWKLTVEGQQTADLSTTVTTSSLQTAVVGLSTVDACSVYSSYTAGSGNGAQGFYVIVFDGSHAGTTVGPNSVSITSGTLVSDTNYYLITDAETRDEIQSLVLFAGGGEYTLKSGADTTTSITYGDSAASIQTKVTGLASVGSGNCRVEGSATPADPMLFYYQSGKAATDMPLIEVDASDLTGGAEILVSQTSGVPGVSQVERLQIKSNVNGGSFPLQSGAAFTIIDWDVVASELQSGVQAIRGMGNSTVTGGAGSFTITAAGSLSQRPITPLQIGLDVTLTASSSINIDVVQPSRGPNSGLDPNNWSLRRPPTSGDVLVMDTASEGWKYDIKLRSTFSRSGNLLTNVSGAFWPGQRVRVRSTGTLPAGLGEETDYYVSFVNTITGEMQLTSDAVLTTPVSLTTAGTGTHFVSVVLAGYKVLARFSGDVGLPRINENGNYTEYRDLYLQVDYFDDSLVEIGQGDGGGVGLMRHDAGNSLFVTKIYRTGSPLEADLPPVLLLNKNSDSKVVSIGGQVGIALLPDEESMIGILDIRGGDVKTGELFACRTIDKTSGTYTALNTSITSGNVTLIGG
jgi:hypothetical protein